ncbi:MAG: murein biosynthesis integral membrane protein MurJ [Candidatus Nealsonbacteria bacterium]|nr:murein biosynthesis integral membrane protein MurJ [Candidatus Nealsonbacteria bacterium]
MRALFNSQAKTIGGATAVLIVFSVISGFFGLLSDRLLAARFGAGIEASIYFAAFKIPDVVYNILILGGILVAFLPIFAEYFAKSQEGAWQMANHVLSVFFFLLAISAIILFILSPWLVKLMAPGFTESAQSMLLILVRILLVQPIILGISNIFSGVLHYFSRFLAYSLAPILYNFGIIFGILFLTPRFGIYGVGIGVILGAFLHLLIQIIAAVNCGFKFHFSFDLEYLAIKRIFILMIPRIFGIAANQINLIVITAIASTIASSSIAVFNFANNLQGMLTGVLGISLATAAFPAFSKLWVNGQKKEFSDKLSIILRQIFFLVIPASILLFLLRAQLVRIVLGTGNFGWQETRLTAASLGLFAFSIFASTLVPLLTRTFFSFQDTKTPTIVSLISVSVNIGFSFLFISLFKSSILFADFFQKTLKLQGISDIAVVALPLAFSISAILQFVLLSIFLYKKIGGFKIKKVIYSLKNILIASTLMAVAVYFVLRFSANFVNMSTFGGVFLQAVLAVLSGAFVYIFTAYYLSFPELKTILSLRSLRK